MLEFLGTKEHPPRYEITRPHVAPILHTVPPKILKELLKLSSPLLVDVRRPGVRASSCQAFALGTTAIGRFAHFQQARFRTCIRPLSALIHPDDKASWRSRVRPYRPNRFALSAILTTCALAVAAAFRTTTGACTAPRPMASPVVSAPIRARP